MPTTPTPDDVPSPVCGHPVPTPNAECRRPDCLTDYLDDDRRYARSAGMT